MVHVFLPGCKEALINNVSSSSCFSSFVVAAVLVGTMLFRALRISIAKFEEYPLRTGVLCAGGKGALADFTSQMCFQDGDYRLARTFAFGLWNAAYCGVAVHMMYSVLAPRWLPTTRGHPKMLRNVLLLVGLDNFFATPLLCLPTYYTCHAALDATAEERRHPAQLVRTALSTYASEMDQTLKLSWSLWIPIHFVTFTAVPSSLRVHFSAVCSFGTLIVMSMLQGKLELLRRPRAAASVSERGVLRGRELSRSMEA